MMTTKLLAHIALLAVGVNAATGQNSRRFGLSATTSMWHDPTQTPSGPKVIPLANLPDRMLNHMLFRFPRPQMELKPRPMRPRKIDSGEAKR
ncbi:hypothetical protein FRC03_004545 [Tulasnella sp. 419]|nr:hypothetical protein FRC03_004545 [Tulasnella sp. 419]